VAAAGERRRTRGVDQVDQEIVALALAGEALEALLVHLVVQGDTGGPVGRQKVQAAASR